jgi:hypothetical protein
MLPRNRSSFELQLMKAADMPQPGPHGSIPEDDPWQQIAARVLPEWYHTLRISLSRHAATPAVLGYAERVTHWVMSGVMYTKVEVSESTVGSLEKDSLVFPFTRQPFARP